jgi:ankyrin repeat protein
MKKEWQRATSSGDLNHIRVLLAGGQDIDDRDEHGQTALMNAARCGQEDVVRVLIDAEADLNVTAKYNLTALMLAIINGHGATAELLVGAGADAGVRASGAAGFSGKTALQLAEERGLAQVAAAIRRSHRPGTG